MSLLPSQEHVTTGEICLNRIGRGCYPATVKFIELIRIGYLAMCFASATGLSGSNRRCDGRALLRSVLVAKRLAYRDAASDTAKGHTTDGARLPGNAIAR